jgi:hypothetical protein
VTSTRSGLLWRLSKAAQSPRLTSPKCSWSKPIAPHGRDERPPPDRWITRLVAGAVTLVVVVGALVVANLLAVVGIVRIVRHDARLGAKVLKHYNAFILPRSRRACHNP